MILFALLTGAIAMGAFAAPSVHHVSNTAKPARSIRMTGTMPHSCTISLTGSLSVGFGTVTATCSATEGTCDLAQTAASICHTSILRSLRNQLK